VGTPEASQRVREGLNRAVYSQHLSEVLARQRIDCVIDVGAHLGEYGRLLRGIGYEGEIVSIEPVASSYAELEAAMSAQPPWRGRRAALGAAPGEAEMAVYRDSAFSAIGKPTVWGRRTFPGLDQDHVETVTVERLDDVYGELLEGKPDARPLLKIDVQGSEWEVLDGAVKTLPKVGAVQVEAAVLPVYEGVRPYTDVLERLEGFGLEISGMFPVSRDADLRIVELDCLLVRAEAAG
jgi:FkbM family methyltransferase